MSGADAAAPFAPKPPLLATHAVRFAYGSRPVLREVTFSLDAGERVALYGPNGAGKTSLLEIVVGLRRPDSGTVTLEGRPFEPRDPSQRRRIGFVGHGSLCYDGLTGRENLEFTARLWDVGAGAARRATIERALEEVGLVAQADRPVRTYSRGMQQRLALARALLPEPRLLVADEPTSGLDPDGREICERLFERARAGGCAILASSHDLDGAGPPGARVAFLRRGRWEEAGRVEHSGGQELSARYEEAFGPGGRS